MRAGPHQVPPASFVGLSIARSPNPAGFGFNRSATAPRNAHLEFRSRLASERFQSHRPARSWSAPYRLPLITKRHTRPSFLVQTSVPLSRPPESVPLNSILPFMPLSIAVTKVEPSVVPIANAPGLNP